MTSVLTNSDYGAIRTIVNATNDDFTDNDFSSSALVPAVNAIYATPVPDYSLLSGNDAALVKASAVHYAGAFCTPILRIRTGGGRRVKLGDFETQDNKVDWTILGDSLVDRAKLLLMQTTFWSTAQTRRSLFITTGPTSSGGNWPFAFNQWRAMVMPLVIVWASVNGMDQNWFLEN